MKAHRIDIHLFHQFHILNTDFFVGRASAIRMKRMTIDTFHHYFHAIHIKSIAFAKINSSKTNSFGMRMHFFTRLVFQIDDQLIKFGRFGRPVFHLIPLCGNLVTCCGRFQFLRKATICGITPEWFYSVFERKTFGQRICKNISTKFTIGFGIYSNAFDMI